MFGGGKLLLPGPTLRKDHLVREVDPKILDLTNSTELSIQLETKSHEVCCQVQNTK